MAKEKLASQEEIEYYYKHNLGAVNSVLNSYNNNQGSFFDSRIDDLKDLRDECLTSEINFFSSIGYNDPNPKRNLEQLQQKITEWNNCGAADIMMNQVLDICSEIMAKYNGIDFDEVITAFSNNVATDYLLQDIAINDETEEELKNQFFNLLSGKEEELTGSGFNKKKFNQYVTITKFNGRLKISFNKNMSPYYQTRFAQIYNDSIRKMPQDTIEQYSLTEIKVRDFHDGTGEAVEGLVQDIMTTIQTRIKFPASYYISQEIGQNFEHYGIARNIVVIKGFLGEIYWNAFFHWLGYDSIPTGVVKDLKNRSIAIDMILHNAGFQIKAYNISKEGTVTFHGNNLAANFIQDRAQVESPLSEILIELFGMWSYNTPVSYATQDYKNFYQNLENTILNMDSVFQIYSDRIIGLDRKFGVSNTNLPFFDNGEDLYFNSFFLINDKVVPSSSILTAIIDSFEQKIDRIKFKGSYKQKEGGAHWYLQEVPPLEKLANQVNIKWDVTLKVNDVIKAAYEQF